MTDRTTIRVGGAAFTLAALAFTAVFAYLAAAFDYPDVLDGRASDVLPRLRALGASGRAVWAAYAFLPLLLVPGAVGAFTGARAGAEGAARLGLHLAVVAALAMTLGLARWPTVHWALAEAFAGVGPDGRIALGAVFDGLNLYLGTYVGEFVGEVALFSASAAFAAALRRVPGFPRWVTTLGLVTAAAGLVGAFRNVTDVVGPVSDVVNGLLPLWLLALGVALARHSPGPARRDGLVQ